MITLERLRELMLSFPETTEESQLEKTSFRVKKKIFATYEHNHKLACVKFSEASQKSFCTADKSTIYAVEDQSGDEGWTNINLAKVSKDLFKEALITAYSEAAPTKLAEMVRNSET